jgi:hypothetical protein
MSGGDSNWGIVGQPWNAMVGTTVGNGGDSAAMGTGASPMDRARRGAGRLGEAQYPAGYLGTYNSKNSGKESASDALLRSRLGDKAYQRGVHKDTKMPPSSYFWPAGFSPDAGLANQAQTAHVVGNTIQTLRFQAMGDPVERYMHGRAPDDTPNAEMASVYRRYGINPDSATNPDRINPATARVMSKYLPSTSW